jgi:DNA-binding PadR family transcriptional regulator
MPTPTTTSYAVLGLLALRPFTAYELTQQSKRSFRFFWPRSEANIYAEPKRLVELGWATAGPERVGQRTRTGYRITQAGRTALRAWLATPPAPPVIEIEGFLRLLHADHGTVAEIRAALHTTRDQALELLDAGRAQVEGYLRDGGPFPQRLHIIAVLSAGYADLLAALVDWCELALQETATWPTTTDLGMTPSARKLLDHTLERHAHRFSSVDPPRRAGVDDAAGTTSASPTPVRGPRRSLTTRI